jgi:sec-independent protein translocase protein TatB
VFGLSFGELCVLVIVAIVVIGPKDMPKVLRKAGQLANKIRRMASDVRTQSGIDEVLRAGGLNEDIAEIRKLAQADFLSPVARPPAGGYSDPAGETAIVREREYPREGADSYDATPDTAILYASASAPSPLARDPLYVMGDANASLPSPDDPATARTLAGVPAPDLPRAPS